MRIKIFLCIILLSNLYSTCPVDDNIKITVIGTALNAKFGALVQAANGGYYIDGLAAWDKKYYGKKVKVTGRLVVEKHESRSTDSVLVAEIVGNVSILKNPKWQLAE